MKTNLYVEFEGEKVDVKLVADAFKESWKEEGGRIKDIDSVDLYYKPDEKACYYFIPATGVSGKVAL